MCFLVFAVVLLSIDTGIFISISTLSIRFEPAFRVAQVLLRVKIYDVH